MCKTMMRPTIMYAAWLITENVEENLRRAKRKTLGIIMKLKKIKWRGVQKKNKCRNKDKYYDIVKRINVCYTEIRKKMAS